MSTTNNRSLIDALHLRETFEVVKRKVVPQHKSSVWYYMGGLCILFFIVQIVTGVLLLFYYQPTVEAAHKSITRIVNEVPFGWLIRSLHSWSANALVLTAFIHMFSAMLMKAYRAPRRILWVTGMILLALMLGFGFTGYLLPWDETAYFATKIGTEVPKAVPFVGDIISALIKGAADVNGATLTRSFALHVGVLPVLSILFVLLHVGLMLLFGSSSPVGTEVKGETRYFPDYLIKEMMVWLIGFGILVAIAVIYPWGLGKAYDIANPSEPPAGVHPEWYFMFLFQTLKLLPEWLVVIGFVLVAVFWTTIPWLDKKADREQRSPLFTWIGIVAIVYMTAMTAWAYVSVSQERVEAPVGVHATTTDSAHAK
ncbi:MAG: cytochrome bc complex cytochrome b subunit [Bacteroidetes bacterium]|nr:cytochrome bc complex cytochrome b subunit [Bacteroidota bacterium]